MVSQEQNHSELFSEELPLKKKISERKSCWFGANWVCITARGPETPNPVPIIPRHGWEEGG